MHGAESTFFGSEYSQEKSIVLLFYYFPESVNFHNIYAGSQNHWFLPSRLTRNGETLQYAVMREGFVFRKKNGIAYYACQAIEELSDFHHGFSTRRGGLPDSFGSSLNLGYTQWDSPERVDANRRRFLAALNLDQTRLATLRQIHSDRVHIIEDVSRQGNQSEGDALVTQCENIAIAVLTADCLPILVADPLKKVAAVVHSGWRGTLARILQKTIQEMECAFKCNPAQLIAAIGPGIRACCFEVDEDVTSLFEQEYPGCCLKTPVGAQPGKGFLDLSKALEIQLNQAGIKPENSYDLGACTRCNTSDFFSFRAEGKNSGRMMAMIGIRR
jgi:polyphenol oxidase